MTKEYTSGSFTKISINGTPMAAISCGLGMRKTHLERLGLRGTRSHHSKDIRNGPRRTAGVIRLEPSPSELAVLMAWVMGSGGNGTNAVLTETLASVPILVDRYTGVDSYPLCYANRLTLSGRQGGVLSADIDVIAIGNSTTAAEASSNSTINTAADDPPYIFSDITLTLASNSRDAESFNLVIDNHIDAERFLNYVDLRTAVALDRTVSLQTVLPWNDANQDMYGLALNGTNGTLAMVDTESTNTRHTLTFPVLQLPPHTPDITGKNREVLLTLDMVSRISNAANAEVTFS